MPRPLPLTNLASARPNPSDYLSLTPRTPHSRSSKAEEGFTEVELEAIREDTDDDYRTYSQSRPLLASSAGSVNGYRSRGDDFDDSSRKGGEKLDFSAVVSRLSLVLGGLTAGVLLILIVVSFERPEALNWMVGVTPPNTTLAKHPTESATANADLAAPSSSAKPTHLNPHVISYQNYTKFPLLPTEYLEECNKLHKGFMAHGDYWEAMDEPLDVVHHDDNHNYNLPEGEVTAVCKSTITYMLDGHVGLLADLALMAQVAALARERGRTFLIDDTYWNRGKWTDHFQDVRNRQPGPEPGCRAPPPEELVACPRLARHWIVNSRTAKFHLGHPFANKFEDPYAHALNRLKPIFNKALQSFVETIRPNAHNGRLIRAIREELSSVIASNSSREEESRVNDEDPNDTPYIGVHIRRGDRRTASWTYSGKYVPISDFVQAVKDTWGRVNPEPSTSPDDVPPDPVLYIASDSPSAQSEFSSFFPPDTTFSLSQSQDPELRSLASPGDYFQEQFNQLGEEARINATRGMIVDFAMLSGMWAYKGELIPNATVCTISSSVCRISAVGLGWDRAFGAVNEMGAIDEKGKHWVEIDQKGQIRPVWQAFELFT